MITKGIIKSIDYNGNTCTVRVPFFETANNDEIISTAPISNTPGSYNGYKIDDVVWVAFEDGSMDNPVVIGKLYLGVEAEKADPRGTLNVVDSKVSNSAEIPFDTKLGSNVADNVANTNVPYSSLEQVANSLSTARVDIDQNDRDYGNRFKQVISDTNGKFSKFEQDINGFKIAVGNKHEEIDGTLSSHDSRITTNAESITAEVSAREEAIDGVVKDYTSKIEQTDKDITAEVAETYVAQDGKSSKEAFGWRLKKDKWEVYKKVNNEESNVLEVDENGLTVTGTIEAESGHIGSFTIGEEINSHSGIFSDGYKDKNNNNITSFKNKGKDWIFGDTAEGVYVGTDGIRLGKNFSVDPTGEVIASNLKLTSEQTVVEAINTAKESAISTAASDATTKADDAESNAKDYADEQAKGVKDWVIGDEVFGDVTSKTSLAGNFIATTNIYAQNLQVNAAQINGSLTVGETTDPVFQAVVDKDTPSKGSVTIGGFKVGTNGIYDANFITSFSEATETNKVNKSGVYIGTDGIRLGDNFSVDTSGHVTATSITLQPSNISGLKDKLDDIDGSISNINNAGYQTASQVTQITNNAISTAQLNADYITSGTLNAERIDASNLVVGELEVKDSDEVIIFKASKKNKNTQIGKFNVNLNGLEMYNNSNVGNTKSSSIHIDNDSILMQGDSESTTYSGRNWGSYYHGLSIKNGDSGYGLFGSHITRIYTTKQNWSEALKDDITITDVPGVMLGNYNRNFNNRINFIWTGLISLDEGENSIDLTTYQSAKHITNTIPSSLLNQIFSVQTTVVGSSTPQKDFAYDMLIVLGNWVHVDFEFPTTVYSAIGTDNKTIKLYANRACDVYLTAYCSVKGHA